MRLFEHPDFEQVVLEAKDFSPTTYRVGDDAQRLQVRFLGLRTLL